MKKWIGPLGAAMTALFPYGAAAAVFGLCSGSLLGGGLWRGLGMTAAGLGVWYCAGAALLAWGFVLSLRAGRDAAALLKTALALRLVLLPAYALMAAAGAVCVGAVLLAGFAAALFCCACMSFFLSALLGAGGLVRACAQGTLRAGTAACGVLLQFVPAAGLIAAAVLYARVKHTKRA